MSEKDKHQLIIVTGLSGAGMSSVMKTLEDMGFEVFDNFPLSLVDALLSDVQSQNQKIAIGIDTRSRGFETQAILNAIEKHSAQLLFMTCEDAILKKRFTETRRVHPLAKDKSIAAGIKAEAKMLASIHARAHLTIDTSDLSIHDLKHILKGHFGIEGENLLNVTLTSFGFKHGVPRTADIVMDVRFLKNPHWVDDLRNLTGKDKSVGEYVQSDVAFDDFITHFKTLMNSVLPRYASEGKSYLTIAIGCTGGKHRSVFTVETLKSWLRDTGYQTHIEHRDIKK